MTAPTIAYPQITDGPIPKTGVVAYGQRNGTEVVGAVLTDVNNAFLLAVFILDDPENDFWYVEFNDIQGNPNNPYTLEVTNSDDESAQSTVSFQP